jgi:hypothetical protein
MTMQRLDRIQERFPQLQAELITPGDRYYVELPLEALDEQGSLLDSVLAFTFDTLDMRHLDLRIVADMH